MWNNNCFEIFCVAYVQLCIKINFNTDTDETVCVCQYCFDLTNYSSLSNIITSVYNKW